MFVNKSRSSEWQNRLFSISVLGPYLGKSKRRQRSQVKGSILLSLFYIFKRQEYFLFNRSYVVYLDLYFYRQRVLVITVVKFCPLWWRMTIQTALNHIPHFDFINKTAINGFLIYSFFITSRIFLITLILWIVKHVGRVELAQYKLC